MYSPVKQCCKLVHTSITQCSKHAWQGNQLTVFSLTRDVLPNAVCLKPQLGHNRADE